MKASFLKILYLFKRRPLTYLVCYNLNLIFLLFSVIITRSLTVYHNSVLESIINTNISKSVTVFLLFQSYIFSMGIYLYTPIYEREKKILYLLKLKGMTRLGYWLPQFIVDYSIFVINSIVVYFLIGRIISIIYLCMFGVALILFCYSCSYLFDSSNTAIRCFPIINFVIILIISLILFLSNDITSFIIRNILILVYPFCSLQDYLLLATSNNFVISSYFMMLYPLFLQILIYLAIIVQN